MDADGNPVGSDPGKQEKLSEDDEEQGEIGKPDKKKPIEKMGKSELYPASLTPARQREMMAHDIAKLRKSPEMVTIGPQNHPYGYDRTQPGAITRASPCVVQIRASTWLQRCAFGDANRMPGVWCRHHATQDLANIE